MTRQITVVTGPMRSGTSCVIGMLEVCGFQLGDGVRILRDETPSNPRGHLEPALLFVINQRILGETPGGSWDLFNVPGERDMAALADQRERYFQTFIRKFNGNICKDPLLCLTLPYWERHWKDLEKAIFCLRHPVAVGRSMQARYGVTWSNAVEIWHLYTDRFFSARKRSQVYIFDFDKFSKTPTPSMIDLLCWLGREIDPESVAHAVDDFYDPSYLHTRPDEMESVELPDHVWSLYDKLRGLSGPLAGTLSTDGGSAEEARIHTAGSTKT